MDVVAHWKHPAFNKIFKRGTRGAAATNTQIAVLYFHLNAAR